MGGRAFANFELVLSALVLFAYFLFAPVRAAFAPSFIPLAWVPFLFMFAVHNYIDRYQWAALRVGRMALLQLHATIDPAIARSIQAVLIPDRVAPFMPLYQLLFVLAFTVLLFHQGWLVALLALVGGFFVSAIISGFLGALPSVGVAADRRRLAVINSCLQRRLLVQPGDDIIPGISRLELHRTVEAILQNPSSLQAQYLDRLREDQRQQAR
jgi:hypothetical protein